MRAAPAFWRGRPPARVLWRRAGLVALFLLPFLVPLPDVLKRHRWLDIPGDLAHVPLFAFFAWALHRRGPLQGRALAAAVTALVTGAAIEVIQGYTGREMSFGDWLLDLCGVGFMLCWTYRRRWRRAVLVAAVAASAALPLWRLWPLPGLVLAEVLAARRFPLLGDFETAGELPDWRPSNEGVLRVVPRDGGGHALAITGTPPAKYPGVNLDGFPRDWRGWRRLEWDARADEGDSVRFIMRLDDYRARQDGAWLAGVFIAGRQWRHFVWAPDSEPGLRPSRPQDRTDMQGITIYIAQPALRTTLEIDNLRLTR